MLCFDSDNAGQNAAVRSLDSLLASGLAVRVAIVPPPHDPDSYIKENGGEAFRQLIAGAEGFSITTSVASVARTTSPWTKVASGGAEMAEAVQKPATRAVDKYAQKTALRLGVTPEAVRREFSKTTAAPVAAAEDEYFDSAAAETEEAIPRPTTPELCC